MVGAIIGVAAAIASASIALGSSVLDPPSPTGPVSPFGGSAPVHIAHTGHIEVDLADGSGSNLVRIPCASESGPTTCYVAPQGG